MFDWFTVMVRRLLTLPLILLCFFSSSDLFAVEKPHVVLVVGTHHYSAHRSLPPFAQELERLGFRTTLVMGKGDPEKKTKNVLPGIEKLEDADVLVLYARFLNLPDNEWGFLERYIKSGKPIIAMRTTNHAVRFPKGSMQEIWNDSFGRRVIGTPYIAHQDTTSEISVVDKHKAHPILNGVSNRSWESPAKLYLTRLEPGCVPLLIGDGQGREKTLEKGFGTIHVDESETDIVAWTWTNEWGAKVFSTTLGHAGDFAEESFMRILVNSICWSTETELLPVETEVQTLEIEMEVPSKYKARK